MFPMEVEKDVKEYINSYTKLKLHYILVDITCEGTLLTIDKTMDDDN
jgi:hypothetical protein